MYTLPCCWCEVSVVAAATQGDEDNDLRQAEGGEGGPRLPLCQIRGVLSLLLLHFMPLTPRGDKQVSLS